MQGYNGLAMFFRNNTQLFMEAKFTKDEDYKFLHKLAREMGSGEQAWRQAGVDHHDDKQHHLLEKRKKRQDQAQKNAERIAGIAIGTSWTSYDRTTGSCWRWWTSAASGTTTFTTAATATCWANKSPNKRNTIECSTRL